MKRSLFDYVQALRAGCAGFVGWLAASTEQSFVVATEQLLHEAVEHLEKSKNDFAKTGENGLSSVVVCFLNRHGVQASRETNSNGHVDLLVTHQGHPQFSLCGEAKVWSGKRYHIEGLGQLLGYMTGRFPHGFVLVYVKKGRISTHFDTLRQALDAEKPHQQRGGCTAHPHMDWSLYTSHTHSSGKVVRILHLGVNMAGG